MYKVQKIGIVLAVVFLVMLYCGCNGDTENTTGHSNDQGMTVEYGKTLPRGNIEDTRVFYSILSDNDKAVYELFLDLVHNKDRDGYENTLVVMEDQFDKLGSDYFYNIYYAMCYDHPEFFYLLTGGKPRIHSQSTITDDLKNINYSLDDAPEGENDMIVRLNEAADSFLQGIDLNADDEVVEKQIHDRLIELVSYNYDLYDGTAEKGKYDLASTAYGALVCDSSGLKNSALCGGYAFAFEYLCQRAGIPCAYITGIASPDAGDKSKEGYHAWNIIKIGDEWLETDVNWDDFDYDRKIEDAQIRSHILNDNKLTYEVAHYFYNRSYEEMRYIHKSENTSCLLPGGETAYLREDSFHRIGDYELGKTDKISMALNSQLLKLLQK